MIPVLYLVAEWALPERIYGLSSVDRQPVHAFICSLCGLISGCVIGFITEYYTSHSYGPVRELA